MTTSQDPASPEPEDGQAPELVFGGLPPLPIVEETDTVLDEHAPEVAGRIADADAENKRFEDTRNAG